MTPAQLLQAARAARLLRGWKALEQNQEPSEQNQEPSDATESKNDTQPQVIQEMSDLIQTAELLRNAVWAKDKEKASGATASLLLEFITAFAHDDDYMRNVLPSLGRLNDLVLIGEFDEAEAHILAWLARLRQTAALLASALRK